MRARKKITRMDLAALSKNFVVLTDSEKSLYLGGKGTTENEENLFFSTTNELGNLWPDMFSDENGVMCTSSFVYGEGGYGPFYGFGSYDQWTDPYWGWGGSYDDNNFSYNGYGANDCVARTLANAMSRFGNNNEENYDEINDWINSIYGGNGVKSDGYIDVIGQYFTYFELDKNNINGYNDSMDKNGVVIAVLKPNSGNPGHSVTIQYISSDGKSVMYFDDQAGLRGSCTMDDIDKLVRLTGLK